MAELIAIAFEDETSADRAESELERSGELQIEADAMAVVIRDGDGTYRVHTNHHVVAARASWAMVWEALFAVLFFVPVLGTPVGPGLEALIAKIERFGIEEQFRERVRDLLQPGSSMLIAIVGQPITDRLVNTVSAYGGTAATSPLSDAAAARVQDHLHGAISSA